MLQLVELVMISLDGSKGPPDEALSKMNAFSGAHRAAFLLRTQNVQADLRGWSLSIETRTEENTDGSTEAAAETHDDQRVFAACLREWPVTRRIEAAAGADDDLRAWVTSEDALAEIRKPLAEGDAKGDAILSDAEEGEVIEWTTEPGNEADKSEAPHAPNPIRATLHLHTDRPATLTLATALESRAMLFAVAHEIVETLPFVIMPLPIDLALREPVKAAKLKLPKHATPTDAFAEIGKSVAAHWFGNDAASRAGLEAEHVHQLRVAQRRLKTALKLFPEWIDDTWNTQVAPDLKWFGDLLADARDWDVFTDTTLPAYAASDDEDKDRQHKPHKDAWAPLKISADTQRMAARQRLQDAMTSPRYARLALSFVQWFSQLETPPDHQHRTLAEHAQKRISKHYRRIERAPDLTTVDARTRHKVRIHAKRLRYALEFFRSLITRRTRDRVEKALGNLQSVLGEGNDAAVAAQRLAGLKEAGDFQKGLAKGFAVTAQRMNAAEGERILRKIKLPRIK
jgi:CHAD domain-containing protein